jgi:hypothetical protein
VAAQLSGQRQGNSRQSTVHSLEAKQGREQSRPFWFVVWHAPQWEVHAWPITARDMDENEKRLFRGK